MSIASSTLVGWPISVSYSAISRLPSILAFEQHAVEIEDESPSNLMHQSSNSAVPTRTGRASITAVSIIADMPMLSPATSWRRRSFASNAK